MSPPPPLQEVREEVRHVLGQSAAWQTLDPTQRQAFAQNMVTVGNFLAKDPAWLDAPLPPGAEGLAAALGPVDDLKKRLADKPGQVDFKGNAMRQGVEEFGNLVKTVDFPAFVAGLIQGVFQAIVDASIQQMEAFGELLAATAKSVDQFAQDHIGDSAVREQLVSRYPGTLTIANEDGASRLVMKEGAEGLGPVAQTFGLPPGLDLGDPNAEQKLVAAAKLESARQRQKMMALMVMLGINRIVVTNGRINAKVIFDVDTSDAARRKAKASLDDEASSEANAAAATWQPWGAAGVSARDTHRTTVKSAIDDSSESKAQMKAQLSGEVRVNFKSETLPPERMLDALQMDQFQHLSQPGGAPAPAAPAPVAQQPAPAPAPGVVGR